jgi:hypothetical protein
VRTDVVASFGTTSVQLEDYRTVDGLQLPWLTRNVLPGAIVTFTVTSIRHGQPIDGRVFQRPRS